MLAGIKCQFINSHLNLDTGNVYALLMSSTYRDVIYHREDGVRLIEFGGIDLNYITGLT